MAYSRVVWYSSTGGEYASEKEAIEAEQRDMMWKKFAEFINARCDVCYDDAEDIADAILKSYKVEKK